MANLSKSSALAPHFGGVTRAGLSGIHFTDTAVFRLVENPATTAGNLGLVLDALVGDPSAAHLGRSNWSTQMNWRHYVLLFSLGLIVNCAIAQFQTLPGYMDADYYFAGGIQLATGKGFTEPYIWNYLSDPKTLPTPSHTYWMPLASIISAVGMWLASETAYSFGRFPFILLSACVPVLTAILAFNLSQNRRVAIAAGLLAIFSHYYAPSMPAPDNYAIYMLLGSGFLLLVPRPQKWIPFTLGLLAGLMTLARSDGLLWLGLAGLTVLCKANAGELALKRRLVCVFSGGFLILLGYLLVMGPWHYRTWTLFDTFLTPGGGRLLWLQDYRETFVYPAEKLTREHFLQIGWEVAIQNRLNALASNFNTTIFAQGGLFLLPLVLIGLWQFKKELRIKIAFTGWLLLFVVMSVIFPFAGVRGSFFHAGAAFQPLWWALTPLGLEALLVWVRKRGQFTDQHAPVVFQGLLVVLMIAFTAYLVDLRVVSTGWAQDDVIYASVEEKFQENGISPMDVVIVRNPPGYYVRTRRSAVLLPYGDESSVLAVAKQFKAAYLVLEKTNSLGEMQVVYENPEANPVFIYLGEVRGARLYRLAAR